MSFIFKLNKFIVVPVLTDWLRVDDFVMFDSAVGGQDQRKTYNALCSEFASTFRSSLLDDPLPLTMGMIDWLGTRQLGSMSKFRATNSMLLRLEFAKQGSLSSMMSYLNSISIGSSSLDVSKLRLKLFSQLVELRSLEINRCSGPNFNVLCLLLQHCHALESFEFTDSNAASVVLHEVANSCNQLTRLNLDSSQGLEPDCIIKVIRNCPKLTSINLNNTLIRSRDVMICMALHGRNLTEIIFREWINVDILAFHARNPLLSFTRRYQFSGTLALLCYRGRDSLIKLNVSRCKLPAYGVSAIASACKALTDLDLSHCPVEITESAATSLQQLKRLNLSEAKGLTDESLILISTHCSLLEELLMSSHQEVTALGVANLSKLTAIVKLTLVNMKLSVGADNPLLQIVTRCRIRVLDISGNYELDDSTVVEVLSHCHRLSYIGVTKCRQLTDRTLTALERFADSLVMLQLGYNRTFSDNGVVSLISQCGNLQTLGLSGCTKITDATAKAVCEHLQHRLVELNIMFCSSILFLSSYSNIIMKCKRLRRLSTSYNDSNLLHINRKTNPDLNISFLHPSLYQDNDEM